MAVADEAATDSDPTADLETDIAPGPGLALTGHLGTGDEGDLDEPLPNAESLVEQAVGVCGPDHATASLVGRFWRFAPDEELIGFTAQEMYDAAVAHRDLAAVRLPGELKLAITPPSGEQCHTVVQIVTDDMPFLVDSVIALLTAHQLQVHLLVHPLIVVRREPLGALSELAADVEPDDAIDGDVVESWIRIEIDPIRRGEVRGQLHNEVRRVLTDVRDAVSDPRAAASSSAITTARWRIRGQSSTASRTSVSTRRTSLCSCARACSRRIGSISIRIQLSTMSPSIASSGSTSAASSPSAPSGSRRTTISGWTSRCTCS